MPDQKVTGKDNKDKGRTSKEGQWAGRARQIKGRMDKEVQGHA